MSKGAPIKRSKRNNNENVFTLDQYFIRKKPAPCNHHSSIKNENNTSFNNAKQQNKTATTIKNEMNESNHQRNALTEVATTMTWNTKSTGARREQPIKSSFVVLRDNNSQVQGVTETQQQDQHDINTPSTTQSQFNTQIVPFVDTLDSQASITSSPMALGDSQDSFLGSGGVEFRVDSLANDDESDDEFYNHQQYSKSLFFDDMEQVQNGEDVHDSQQPKWQWGSDITDDKPTDLQPFDSDDEIEDNNMTMKTINIYSSAPEIDKPSHGFSVFNSLPFSHDDTIMNHCNLSDEEDGNESLSLLQSNTSQSISASQQQQFTSSSSFPFSLTSSLSSLQHTSFPDSSDLLTTLPMSPSHLDQSLDVHVAYPVPRGTHIVDKFGK